MRYQPTEIDVEHGRRLERLRELTRHDQLSEREDVRALCHALWERMPDGTRIGYEPRTPEQIAAHAAALAELEIQAQPALADLARMRRIERLQSAGDVPVTAADLQALHADTLERTRAVREVRRWVEASAVPLFVLSGPPGVGKTLAAAHCLAHIGGHYVRAPELARLFLAQFGEDLRERERLVSARGVLVCDDLGCERHADVMQHALTELLDARRRGQRTIWVTNLDRRTFEQRYGDPRLLSRMAQSARWLVDVGADLRRASS